MPIGSDLANRIQNLLHRDLHEQGKYGSGPITDALSRSGGYTDIHREAMSRILNGIHSVDSIDQFIHDCRKVEELPRVAKLCIAHLVLEAERKSTLHKAMADASALTFGGLRNTWLGRICRKANPGVSRQDFLESMSGISFITFNYDRCIEQFLRQWAELTLAIDREAAFRLAAQIPVIHAYGSLGTLPGLSDVIKMDELVFGEDDARYVNRGAGGIRTFTEEIESNHWQNLRFLVLSAHTIVFLGCAFHQQNLRVLFPDGPHDGIDYYGTNYGMRFAEIQDVGSYFSKTDGKKQFLEQKCASFVDSIEEAIFRP
jgi:hypothetical protein